MRNLCKAFVFVQVTIIFFSCVNEESSKKKSWDPDNSGPRLGLVTENSATVYWDTIKKDKGVLKYKKLSGKEHTLKEKDASFFHRLTISGLKESSTYQYYVQNGKEKSKTFSFITAPSSDVPFIFVSMGDNRGRSTEDDANKLTDAFYRIISQVISHKPSFVVHVGDIFCGDTPLTNRKTIHQMYSSFKDATDPLAGQFSFLVSPGNHEMDNPHITIDPLVLFNIEFAQPKVLDNYEGTCFSWNWGKSHFVSVDSCRFDKKKPKDFHGMYLISDEEIEWLEKDLIEARERNVEHIFVFSHTNAFETPNIKKQDEHYLDIHPEQRDKFWSILAKYRIDAYICGHQHGFEQRMVDGVLQWCNGNSGCLSDGNNDWTLWNINGSIVTAILYNEYGVEVFRMDFNGKQKSKKL